MNSRIAAKYISQSVLGMIGISIYILADTYFIAQKCGAAGLTALNLTLPVYGLMYAIGQMLGIGSAVIYSLRKAEGRPTDSYFMQAFIWTCLFSIPFVLFGGIAPDKLLMLFGADQAIASLGTNYVRIISFAAPLFMTNYVFAAFARNDNGTGKAMVGALAGSMFNIVFDYIFMYPMGLGFTGAAMATVGCPLLSIGLCILHFRSERSEVGFRIPKLSLHMLVRSCSLGFSGFIGEFSTAVTTAVFNFMMLSLAGNIGVAAYGVIANIAIVCMTIFNGVAQGLQPLISDEYGHAHYESVKKLLRLGLAIVTMAAVAYLLIGYSFTDTLVGLFNSQKDMTLTRYAERGMKLYFLGFLVAGINVVLISYYSATGDAKPVVIGSLLRGLIFIAGFAVLLGELFGMDGVWLSFLVAEAGTLCFLLGMHQLRKQKTI